MAEHVPLTLAHDDGQVRATPEVTASTPISLLNGSADATLDSNIDSSISAASDSITAPACKSRNSRLSESGCRWFFVDAAQHED